MSKDIKRDFLSQSAKQGAWVDSVLEQRAAQQRALNLPDALKTRIANANGVWSKLQFPTPRLEEWKYTDLGQVAGSEFLPVNGALDVEREFDIGSVAVLGDNPDVARVVFIDGIFSAKLSKLGVDAKVLQIGVASQGSCGAVLSCVGSLEQHIGEPLAALATSLFSDCVTIAVAAGNVVTTPIEVVNIATKRGDGCVVTPRIYIEAGENSQLSVVESYASRGGERYLTLPMLEIVAQRGAIIDHYRVQCEALSANHLSGISAKLAADSEVRTQIFSFGGALVRNEARLTLNGSGACGVINGLSQISGEQHVDNTTVIHHVEPHCESRELFKGIYNGKSRGVFSGTIIVDQIAQKTNAFQSNQALLLSNDAGIDSRPQLKIWADDVKCTHGATVGQLDSEALAYLRSRGIGLKEAKAFLVKAFAGELLTGIRLERLREWLDGEVSRRLGEGWSV
jgi:Fe-S cluster assembly protein SufD